MQDNYLKSDKDDKTIGNSSSIKKYQGSDNFRSNSFRGSRFKKEGEDLNEVEKLQ
jgi:hypothetical protein